MLLTDALRGEHLLIEQVAGSLVRFANDLESGASSDRDARDFVVFMRGFAAGYHHQREEEILFRALVDRAEVPWDRGPIAVLMAEHRDAAALVTDLETAAGNAQAMSASARRLAHLVWEHVDKENSVLLPEAEKRLIRSAVNHLDDRSPTADEVTAREIGESLVTRYPPLEDPDVIRGDGCVACSAFAVTCGGIEKEWWSDWEAMHYRSLDEG